MSIESTPHDGYLPVSILQATFDTLLEHLAVIDQEGTILAVNKAWRRFARENGDPPPDQIGVGANYLAVCARSAQAGDTDAERILTKLRQMIEVGEGFTETYRCDSEKEVRWFRMRADACDTEPKTWLIVHQSITEYKLTQAALQESEARYRTLVEQIPVVTYLAVPDQLITTLYISPQVEAMLGYPQADWTASPDFFVEKLHPDDRERVLIEILDPLSQPEPLTNEYRMIGADGEIVWIHDEAVIVRDEQGRPMCIQGVMLDITEEKQIHQALRERRRQYETLVAFVPVGIFRLDQHGHFIFVNSRLSEITGLAADAIKQDGWLQLLVPDQLDQVLADFNQSIIAALPFEMELKLILPDGLERWVVCRGIPEFDETEALVGFVGVVIDMTDSYLAEQALADSQQRLQAIFNNTREAVLLADENSCYIDVNLATCELTGYRRAELIQMTVWDLTPNANIEQGQQLWREFIASGQQSGEYTIQRKDGSLVEVEYQAVANILPGMHLSVIRDITERKMGEERLKKSLEEKRLLLQEVHHRVKNNLQLISSMLSLHADTVQDQLVQAIFMESKRRIRSLALIHEELYRSADFTGVHFDRHLRSLVDYLFLSYDANRRHIRFVHQVGDVALVVDQAIPCSLIVNELVSNALKHAFPNPRQLDSRKSKRVWVALTWAASTGYQLTIGDNGVGLPDDFETRQANSLGMRLVRALVRQLDGELLVERETGTIFQIIFH